MITPFEKTKEPTVIDVELEYKPHTENIVEVSEEIEDPGDVVEESTPIPVFHEVQTVSKDVTMFVGKVTHYGPDCTGCSGITASGYNVKNTIYYSDSEYGSVRIVAAPKEIPLYSILILHNYKGDPITVIVLDRGGAIKGTKFDILVSSEKEAYSWGIQNDVEFEILRWGR